MSMSLMFTTGDTERAARDWAAIKAIAPEHGMVLIEESIVDSIARLLEGVTLSNEEEIRSYPRDEDEEYAMPSYVASFGPSLLPAAIQDQIRDHLAGAANGKQAVALFSEVLRRGLMISLHGKEFCGPHISAVNGLADVVEFGRTATNMYRMIGDLGLPTGEDNPCEVDLETFAAAVDNRGWMTDRPERLQAFVACARRNGAQTVYWA